MILEKPSCADVIKHVLDDAIVMGTVAALLIVGIGWYSIPFIIGLVVWVWFS